METPKKNKNEQIENLLENAQQALSQDHLYIRKKHVPLHISPWPLNSIQTTKTQNED